MPFRKRDHKRYFPLADNCLFLILLLLIPCIFTFSSFSSSLIEGADAKTENGSEEGEEGAVPNRYEDPPLSSHHSFSTKVNWWRGREAEEKAASDASSNRKSTLDINPEVHYVRGWCPWGGGDVSAQQPNGAPAWLLSPSSTTKDYDGEEAKQKNNNTTAPPSSPFSSLDIAAYSNEPLLSRYFSRALDRATQSLIDVIEGEAAFQQRERDVLKDTIKAQRREARRRRRVAEEEARKKEGGLLAAYGFGSTATAQNDDDDDGDGDLDDDENTDTHLHPSQRQEGARRGGRGAAASAGGDKGGEGDDNAAGGGGEKGATMAGPPPPPPPQRRAFTDKAEAKEEAALEEARRKAYAERWKKLHTAAPSSDEEEGRRQRGNAAKSKAKHHLWKAEFEFILEKEKELKAAEERRQLKALVASRRKVLGLSDEDDDDEDTSTSSTHEKNGRKKKDEEAEARPILLHPIRAAFNTLFPTYAPLKDAVAKDDDGDDDDQHGIDQSRRCARRRRRNDYLTPLDQTAWAVVIERGGGGEGEGEAPRDELTQKESTEVDKELQQEEAEEGTTHPTKKKKNAPSSSTKKTTADALSVWDWLLPKRVLVPYFGAFETVRVSRVVGADSADGKTQRDDAWETPLFPSTAAEDAESVIMIDPSTHRMPSTMVSVTNLPASSATFPSSPHPDALTHYLHYSSATLEISSYTQLAHIISAFGRATVVMIPPAESSRFSTKTINAIKRLTLDYRKVLKFRHLFLLREDMMPDKKPSQWEVQTNNARVAVVDGGAEAYSAISRGEVASVWEFEVVRRPPSPSSLASTQSPSSSPSSSSPSSPSPSLEECRRPLMDITNARVVPFPMKKEPTIEKVAGAAATTTDASSAATDEALERAERALGREHFTVTSAAFRLTVQRLLEFGTAVRLLPALDEKWFQRLYLWPSSGMSAGGKKGAETSLPEPTIGDDKQKKNSDTDDVSSSSSSSSSPSSSPVSTIYSGAGGDQDSRQHSIRVGKTQRLCRRALKANRKGSSTPPPSSSQPSSSSPFQSLHKYVDRCFNGTIFAVVAEDSGGTCLEAFRSIARQRQLSQNSDRKATVSTPSTATSSTSTVATPSFLLYTPSPVEDAELVFATLSLQTHADKRFYANLISGATGWGVGGEEGDEDEDGDDNGDALIDIFKSAVPLPPNYTATSLLRTSHKVQEHHQNKQKKKHSAPFGKKKKHNAGEGRDKADSAQRGQQQGESERRRRLATQGGGLLPDLDGAVFESNDPYQYAYYDGEGVDGGQNSPPLLQRGAGGCRVLMISPLLGLLKPLWFNNATELTAQGSTAMRLNGGLFTLLEKRNRLVSSQSVKQSAGVSSSHSSTPSFSSSVILLGYKQAVETLNAMADQIVEAETAASKALIATTAHGHGDVGHMLGHDVLPTLPPFSDEEVGDDADASQHSNHHQALSHRQQKQEGISSKKIFGTACYATLHVVVNDAVGEGDVTMGDEDYDDASTSPSSSVSSCAICQRLSLVLLPLLSDVMPWLPIEVYDRHYLAGLVTEHSTAAAQRQRRGGDDGDGDARVLSPSSRWLDHRNNNNLPLPLSLSSPTERGGVLSLPSSSRLLPLLPSSSGTEQHESNDDKKNHADDDEQQRHGLALLSLQADMHTSMTRYLARRVTDQRRLPTPSVVLQIRTLKGGEEEMLKQKKNTKNTKRNGQSTTADPDIGDDAVYTYHNKHFDDVDHLVHFIRKSMAKAQCPMPME